MSRIDVAPTSLTAAADRLRATSLAAGDLRRALAEAGDAVTGSAELAEALAGHSRAWGWALGDLHERVRSLARSLDLAATAYAQVEHTVAAAATTGR